MSELNQSFEKIIKDRKKKKIAIYDFKKTYPAYLILIFLLFISYFIFQNTKVNVKNDQNVQFTKAQQSIITRLENLRNTDKDLLVSMRGLYDILPQVVRDYFEIYGTIPVRTYKSLNSINYVMEVNNYEKGNYVYNTQSVGYFYYKITPEGDREKYYPVHMKVPYDPEKPELLLGFDLKTIPEFARAFEKSKNNQKVLMSDFVKFNLNENRLTGFMFMPVFPEDNPYMKGYQGSLALEIDILEFFEEALIGLQGKNNATASTDSSIIYQFYEVKSNGKKELIYSSQNADILKDNFTPTITKVEKFDFANKIIELHFVTAPNFGGKIQSYLPVIAAGISGVLSLLLFGFILSVITSRGRALDLAEKMTRSQRRIVETTQDIIAAMDFDGAWKSMNPASQKIFGINPDDIIGKSIFDLMIYKSERKELKEMIENQINDSTIRIDVRMKSIESTELWINWSLTKSLEDELIYVIGRDVTLEKIAEEENKLRSRQIQLASYYAQESDETKTMFMINASYNLRNSLTGVLGYLQMIDTKMYDSEEELNFCIKMAEESSENIYSFVSDFVDVAIQGDVASELSFNLTKFDRVLQKVENKLSDKTKLVYDKDISANLKIETSENYLVRSLTEIISALNEEVDGSYTLIELEVNELEGGVNIQILAEPNQIAYESIELYKNHPNDLIEALKFDKKEVMFRLAKASSKLRIINGLVNFDTFGPGEQNLALISLPLKKRIK